MTKIGGCLAGVLAMSVACVASSDDEMAFGTSPVTVGNASSTPSDADDTDGDEDTGDAGEDDDASSPGDTGNVDDGAPPPPSDDGDPPPPPPGDDGNPPPPPPGDDGGLPPADTTPNCQAYCQTLDMCGWLARTGETVEECGFFCSEPIDMGPCDAAWDVLAGCLGGLDCATLEQLDAGEAAACEAEMQAEEQACAGA